MIQKRNIEACEHAFDYWKQNKTHSIVQRELCLGIARQLMALIKSGAPLAEFQALDEKCDITKIDDIGHGGYGLHSAIIAVISDLNSGLTGR